MTTTGEFAAERAQLGTRDRDELHAIASAMGVRGATRLRKADLIEAMLDKATSGASDPEPTGEKPKKRATRKKAAEPAAEAAESSAPAPAPAEANGRPESAAPAKAAEPATPASGARPSAAEGGEAAPAEAQRFAFEGSTATPAAAPAVEAGDGRSGPGPSAGEGSDHAGG